MLLTITGNPRSVFQKDRFVLRSKWIFRIWLIAILALVVNAAVSSYNVNSLILQERIVLHTKSIQNGLSEILLLIVDAETGQRGYVITADPIYLEPYNKARANLPAKQDTVRNLIAGQIGQTDHFIAVEVLIRDRLEILDQSIEMVRSDQVKRAEESILSGKGKAIMDRLRAAIHDLDLNVELLTKNRTTDANVKYRITIVTNIVGTTIALAIVGLAFRIVHLELERRKKAEAAVQAFADRLETTIATRTESLRQTTAELLRSNQELEKFAYVASHDLQEPLRKIQTFGNRLKQKAGDILDETCRNYLERMESSATRMRTLIDDLLSYSRITSQGKPFAVVDLSQIVSGVLSDLEIRIEECHGKIVVGSLPTIHADPTQMRQLFQNLLSNSLKFRRPGVAPRITIRAMAAIDLSFIAVPTPPTTGWRITIGDNGIGFDPTYSERIFELFQRLHERGEFEGTGIGLAICRKIVERHGGQMVAIGNPDVGSEFVFDLPDQSIPVGVKSL